MPGQPIRLCKEGKHDGAGSIFIEIRGVVLERPLRPVKIFQRIELPQFTLRAVLSSVLCSAPACTWNPVRLTFEEKGMECARMLACITGTVDDDVRSHSWLRTSTSRGSHTRNVEPAPGSLRTMISPPIIRQYSRLMVRPRPVPPYFSAVLESA